MNKKLEKIEPELKVELFSLDELKKLERNVVKVVYGFGTKDIDELNPFYERFERLQNASKLKTKDGKICQLCEYDLAVKKTDVWSKKDIFKRCFQEAESKSK